MTNINCIIKYTFLKGNYKNQRYSYKKEQIELTWFGFKKIIKPEGIYKNNIISNETGTYNNFDFICTVDEFKNNSLSNKYYLDENKNLIKKSGILFTLQYGITLDNKIKYFEFEKEALELIDTISNKTNQFIDI